MRLEDIKVGDKFKIVNTYNLIPKIKEGYTFTIFELPSNMYDYFLIKFDQPIYLHSSDPYIASASYEGLVNYAKKIGNKDSIEAPVSSPSLFAQL